MKPGIYFVGDPSYVVNNHTEDAWTLFLMTRPLEHITEVINFEDTRSSGLRLMAIATWYGEGVFYDQHNDPYNVTTGLIGVASVAHLPEEDLQDLANYGVVMEFKLPVTVVDMGKGVVRIGNIEDKELLINTGPTP